MSTGETSGGSFRGHRVVKEPGGPFEAGQSNELREDFQVPVKVFFDRLPVALAWLLPALTPQQPDARQELDESDFGVSSAMR